jgi:uridine phosphorylase
LATLVLQGVRYAGVEGFSRVGTIVAVAVNLSLGLVIVALEVALTH